MKEEGERVYKNNYRNISLRLCIIIHQYISVQSHLLHTHSLPLIHTHTHTHTHTHAHTHTHTHTHTLTHSKSGRFELIRFLEVEKIGFQSRLDKFEWEKERLSGGEGE